MKQLPNTTETLRRIYESGLKLMVPQTLEKTYQAISDEATKLVGGDSGRIILRKGKSLRTVYKEEKKPVKPYISKVRDHGYTQKALQENIAFVVTRDKFAPIYPQLAAAGVQSVVFIPLSHFGNTKGVLTVRSTTKKNFSEEELEILKLFGSMASLAIQKMELYTQAKEALESKNLFIAMAAHELKTPLTSLKIYGQLLEEKVIQKEDINPLIILRMNMEISRITILMNDLLQVKDIKKGTLKYSFQTCRILQILETAVANTKLSHMERTITLIKKLDEDADMIKGDFDKLLQAFTNILTNAIKFSPIKSPIEVKIIDNNDTIQLSFQDKGKGIAKKDLPHIFSEYYRGKNNKAEGMGIGLYLVKNIIEKHKGTIRIDTQENKGTTIHIDLPKLHYDTRTRTEPKPISRTKNRTS